MKLAVLSDIHYYSPSLGTSGSAFQKRERMCQYFLRESGAIVNSAIDEILSSDADAVLIAGDLTNNGEKVCHEELATMLSRLSEKKPVYVIYATHDWCSDGCPRRFDGDNVYHDVETMTPDELAEFYFTFGRNRSQSEFVHENGSVSYFVKLSDKIGLLCLNDDKNGKGKAGLTAEQRCWIREICRDCEQVIAMQHHLIMPGMSCLVNGGQIIGDAAEIRDFYRECGIKFVIVGHSHMQRISEEKGLYQINIGALTGHPCSVTYLTVEDGKILADMTNRLEFDFEGKHYRSDDVKSKTTRQVRDILRDMSDSKEKFITSLDELGIHIKKLPVPNKIVTAIGKRLYNGNVKDVLGVINRLLRFTDKKDIRELADDRFLDYVETLYLSVFDGSVTVFPEDSAVYNIVTGIGKLPVRLKRLPVKMFRTEKFDEICKGISEAAEKICLPEFDAEKSLVDTKSCYAQKMTDKLSERTL